MSYISNPCDNCDEDLEKGGRLFIEKRCFNCEHLCAFITLDEDDDVDAGHSKED